MTISQARTEEELIELQRVFFDIIRRPLLPGEKMAPDDRVADFIQANPTMLPHERLELYAQQYWWRLIGSLMDDFPVTRTLLQKERFRFLCEQYLVAYPSHSYSLRFLGRNFPRFIKESPEHTAPITELCYDTARLECAISEVFLAPEGETLSEDYLKAPPSELTFSLKPALVTLSLNYPAHTLISEERLKMRMGRGEASNVIQPLNDEGYGDGKSALSRAPCSVVVHRINFGVYFKEITSFQLRLLALLEKGEPLGNALSMLSEESGGAEEDIGALFQEWVALGWLCPRR